jgi:hypothetical protein
MKSLYHTEIHDHCDSQLDNTVVFELSSDESVNQLLVTYATTLDDEKASRDFFKRLNYVVIRRGDRILHKLVGTVWSTCLTLQSQSLMRNKKTNVLYIPLVLGGLSLFQGNSGDPLSITFLFSRFENEQDRLGLILQYQSVIRPPLLSGYWTCTNPVYQNMSEVKDSVLSLELPWFKTGNALAQLVFSIPGANSWIKTGSLCAYKKTPTNSSGDSNPQEKLILSHFEDNYHAVVVDKVLFGFPLLKQTLTMTFCNWQKNSCNLSEGLIIGDDSSLKLELELEDLQDNTPQQAALEVFAVIGIPW